MKENRENTDIIAVSKKDKTIKTMSNEILHTDMKLIKLCLAILLGLVSIIMPSVICSAVLYMFNIEILDDGTVLASDLAFLSSGIVLIAAFLFVAIPMISGIYAFAKKVANDEKAPEFIEIFSIFTGGRYWRSILMGLVIILRALIIILPCVGGILLVPTLAQLMYAASPIMIAAVSLFVMFSCIAALLVAVYFASFIYFVPELVLSRGSFKGVFAASVKLSEAHRKDIVKNILSFWWLVVLSVLSLGILFIVYVAPLMLTSYFVFCKELTDNNY